LIAERFARTRGHDEQYVFAIDGGATHCFLIRPEAGESKTAFQQGK
jgi:hypothetical protein